MGYQGDIIARQFWVKRLQRRRDFAPHNLLSSLEMQTILLNKKTQGTVKKKKNIHPAAQLHKLTPGGSRVISFT